MLLWEKFVCHVDIVGDVIPGPVKAKKIVLTSTQRERERENLVPRQPLSN